MFHQQQYLDRVIFDRADFVFKSVVVIPPQFLLLLTENFKSSNVSISTSLIPYSGFTNPAFTIGLAFLQAGAEGKSLGQGALDNVIKAGAVSQQYKKIIESRKQAPIQATAADISETKDLLSKVGISEGNWFENFGSKVSAFFGGGGSKTPGLDYDKAVEEIAVQYQAAVKKKQKELKEAGKPQILRIDDKIKIMDELIKSGKIQKNESFLSKLGITDATIQKREHGGPVHSGESYLVGEKGPEVFIPKETGEVVANDDTQVFSMLLAANPQLQKVSKDRAMKILKAKFPEYFDQEQNG